MTESTPYDDEWSPITDGGLDSSRLSAPLEVDDPTTYRVTLPDASYEHWAAVWGVMAATTRHSYQVVAKPERVVEFFGWLSAGTHASGHAIEYALDYDTVADIVGTDLYGDRPDWPLPNVIIGTTVRTSKDRCHRWDALARIPAAARFIIAEPTESIRLASAPDGEEWLDIDWFHIRGRTDAKTRLSWLRGLVDQVESAGVPVWVERLGSDPYRETFYQSRYESAICSFDNNPLDLDHPTGADPSEWPDDLRVREMPEVG